MNWDIPQIGGKPLRISINPGDRIFMVGPNGSGKSALIQHLVSSKPSLKIRRIAAHRQTWLTSGSVDFTPNQRREFARLHAVYEVQPAARWKDEAPHEKQSAVLFDLVAQDNDRSRRISRHVDDQNTEEAEKISGETGAPFAQLNELLNRAMLAITLDNSRGEEILARHRSDGTYFSMAQMSDGERNAAIIAADVLTLEPETTLLIDEPERHLHRSIIIPFLSAVFERRQDCAFIISTHEVGLPIANPEAQIIMVRSCSWEADTAKAWDVELLKANTELPENLKRTILGSRRRILFVEGSSDSLDLPLYTTLFPEVSVVSQGSCADVLKAVKGLRETTNLHHVEAFGLIDRDNRGEDEVKQLLDSGVFALEVYSVEALYYSLDAIETVARWQANSFRRSADEMIASVKEKALRVLEESDLAEIMAARRSAGRIHAELLSQMPDWKYIRDHTGTRFKVSVESPYSEELERFRKLVADKRLDELVARYPLRKSNLFSTIADALRCRCRSDYEQMVLSRLRDDENLAQKLKQRIGPLATELERATSRQAG